jgi:hypothetical protein
MNNFEMNFQIKLVMQRQESNPDIITVEHTNIYGEVEMTDPWNFVEDGRYELTINLIPKEEEE